MNNIRISNYIGFDIQYKYPVICQLLHCTISLLGNTILFPVFILCSLDVCRTRKIPIHKLCKEYVKVSWRCMTDIFDAYEYVIKWNKKIKPCVRVRINGK